MSRYSESIARNIEKMSCGNRIDLYRSKGSNQDILDVLEQNKNPKKFGVFMEEITKDIFGFGNSLNSEHDFRYGSSKIELKSSCCLLSALQKDKKVFQYNSIRMDYDYEYLMVCNINVEDLEFYIVKKEKFKKYIKSLNLKQKKLKKGILELITFDRLKPIMRRVEPETFEKVFDSLNRVCRNVRVI